MRELLFRGKDEFGWMYGDLVHEGNEIGIETSEGIFPVAPETVGQYTGLCDKNGNKIFEGDILNTHSFWNREPCVVRYGEGTFDSGIYCYTGFYYEDSRGNKDHTSLYENIDVEVIGNIHDNKNLLEE